MANADDFKGLSHDMANAYEDRVERIKNIKSETKKLINTCKGEDKARAAEVSKLKANADKLVEDIAGENKKLKAGTQKLIKDFTGESKKRATEVADLLADYKKERVATATAWKGLLSNMASARKEEPSPAVKVAKAVAKKEKALVEEEMPPKKRGRKKKKRKR